MSHCSGSWLLLTVMWINHIGGQWWRGLFRCRIDLLNFSFGCNIIAPYIRQEYGYFSVKQSLYGLACHENTKLSDCDSALNDHLIQMHVALMFENSCSTKSCKVMRLSLTNPTLDNFLQLLVESKFSLWEYFWIIIAGMKTDMEFLHLNWYSAEWERFLGIEPSIFIT